MKLRFKEQQYQIDAVNSICDIFDGQPKKELIKNLFDREVKKDGLIEEEIIYNTFANPKLRLTGDEILKNLKEVQKEMDLKFQKNLTALTLLLRWKQAPAKLMSIQERFLS